MKILKVEQPGHSTQAGQVLRLETGQRLAAIALTDARPGDRAMLSVAGGQLAVTTQHPLKAGQAIDLEVMRLGQQVHLRPLGPPPDPRQLDQAQLTRNLLQALARLDTAAGARQPGMTGTMPPPGTSRIAPSAGTPGNPPVVTAAPPTPQGTGQTAPAAPTPRPLQAFLANQQTAAASGTEALSRAAASTAPPASSSPTSGQPVPPGLNGLLPLLSALREPRLIQGLVAGWLATSDNPPTQPNPLAGVGGPMPTPAGSGLAETPLGSLLQQAARQLRGRPDLAPRDPGMRQATLDFMQRIGDQVERSQLATALSQGAASHAAGTQTGPTQPVWLVEIPLQLANEAHNLRLAIREEEGGADGADGEGRWQVDLAMDWPRLGPLHAALVLQGGRIDVDLFADRPEAMAAIEASRGALARGLADAGLTPGRLGAYPGPPPASVQSRLDPDTGDADPVVGEGFLSEQA